MYPMLPRFSSCLSYGDKRSTAIKWCSLTWVLPHHDLGQAILLLVSHVGTVPPTSQSCSRGQVEPLTVRVLCTLIAALVITSMTMGQWQNASCQSPSIISTGKQNPGEMLDHLSVKLTVHQHHVGPSRAISFFFFNIYLRKRRNALREVSVCMR